MENESALAKNSARVIPENFLFTRAVAFVSLIRFTAFLSLLDGWKSLPMSTCLSPHHVDGEANLRTAQNGGAVSMKILFLYLSKKPSERLSQNDGFIRFFNAKKAPPMCEKTKRRLGKRSMVPSSINRAMLMVVSMARSRFRVRLNCSMRGDGPAEAPRPDGPQWEHQITYRLVIINNKGKAARCPEGVRRTGIHRHEHLRP
jgi:hypothetical protein